MLLGSLGSNFVLSRDTEGHINQFYSVIYEPFCPFCRDMEWSFDSK